MLYFGKGSEKEIITSQQLKDIIFSSLQKIGLKKKVLVVPPDSTRFHSRSGEITRYIHQFYGNKLSDILPALGTHSKMSAQEINSMFPGVPLSLFRVHNWRKDTINIGEVPPSFIENVSEGKVSYSWPAQVNKLLIEGNYDLIISVGQVVPHEVIGLANYNKNIFIGTGGAEAINKSHYLGAVYGLERIMGQIDTPVRKVLDYAGEHFAKNLPIVYIHTVINNDNEGNLKLYGLYIGDDIECFRQAAYLSIKLNIHWLEKPLKKVVCYLNPEEYKSTWLGNKSIYRTRMAIADEGELIIIAPGIKSFGEDKEIDRLIRKYGYAGTSGIIKAVGENIELQNNLSAAAHLIHGSSEGRFRVTYCPGHISKEEINNVNFNYCSLNKVLNTFNPANLKEGFNVVNGEEIFYVSNPALGLWATRKK